MSLLHLARKKALNWPYWLITVLGGVAAFGCYASMYAFRKAFASATFEHEEFLHIDYKVWLVIAQMVGYTLSKFYGIRFISESGKSNRARSIIFLILFSWIALLGFALVPAPYNIVFLFLNGFPLGMIWGLVFSYLEGRKTTEFMGALMSISLIFASGFVKTVARSLMSFAAVSDYWMPFITGLVFLLPLCLFVFCLEVIPPPSKEDQQLRTKRVPMDAKQRRRFITTFLPGIILTIIIYVLLTCIRDMRDNFEVEIWNGLGIHNNHIYTQIDTLISVVVLIMMGLLILIKDNLKAFTVIHIMIIAGCLLIGVSTFFFDRGYISPISWMALLGMGLYMAYIPYNAIFFERMIANFHYKSNIGFIMYVADSIGYVGSFSVLLLHEFGETDTSWMHFFKQCLFAVPMVGGVCSVLSLIYFRRKTLAVNKKQHTVHSERVLSSPSEG
jgi:MFS family permease